MSFLTSRKSVGGSLGAAHGADFALLLLHDQANCAIRRVLHERGWVGEAGCLETRAQLGLGRPPSPTHRRR
jgi:hypothetical protein